jgi:cysteinyl-tRNA synthetase
MDIHSGGEDLRFPHHDNELAQSEAYFQNKQWVNYFLHSGHLHIEGLKMSKSLKNFVTIREALAKSSARQLRLLFLSQPWGNVMNYAADTLESIRSKEKSINEFFLVVRNILQEQENLANIPQRWNEIETNLHNSLLRVQEGVDAAMKNDFDTPTALLLLLELVRDSNKYIMENKERKGLLLRKIASYITKILRIWGVVFEKDFASVGAGADVEDKEKLLNPYVKSLVNFRNSVRNAAISQKDSALLQLCDELRDEILPPLGVRIEDSGLTPYKFDTPEAIMKEIAEKKATQLQQQKKKLETTIKNISTELEELEKGKDTSQQMFEKEGFKDFDNEGLPNTDKEGKEVSKSAKKKLQKQLQTQQKLNQKAQEKLSKDPEIVVKKQKELQEIKDKLASL